MEDVQGMIKTVVGLVVRWGLKFAGGFLAANGISTGAAEEVAIGLVMAVVGVVFSLVMRKKDLNAPAPGQ